MSQFILWFSIATITLVMAMLFIMPALVRATLPLGVSIPNSKVDEPIVQSSIKRYRTAIVGAWVVGVVLTVVLFTQFPVAASIAPMLVALALGMGAYVLSRRTITHAKRDGGWYQNVPVRLSADISADAVPARPPIGWSIAAVLILLAVVAVGVANYAHVPNPTPIHWNAAGHADNFAPKSVWSVFGPLMVGSGVVALLFACSFLVRVSPVRAVPSDSPARSAQRRSVQRRLMTSMLGQLSVVIAVQIGWLSIAGWLAPGAAGVMSVGVIVLLVLLLAVVVVFVVRYRRAVASWDSPPEADRPDAPDDDRYWKGGIIYVNRNDPSVFVPKRFGVGWSVNLGSAGGMALGIVLVLIVIAAVVTAIVAPGMQKGA